jgi:HK97 family phage portal protein
MSLLSFFGLSPGPTDDFWYRPANGPTVSGVAVDEQVAMTYSACWACTRVLSTAGAMSPLELLRYLQTGGSEPAEDLRRYHLVYDQFNPHMSNFMFRSTGLSQQINWGNFFAEIEFTRADQVLAIHPIHASRVPAQNIKRESDSSVYYLVNNSDGTKTRLESWEMLHVPSPASDDGIFGKGVVTQARLSIGFGIATETQGAAYMGNSARPTIVIKGGKFKNSEEREEYRRMWADVHGGPSNNAKPAFLPPEADMTPLNWSAEDSQFLETRQHNVEEVARWYGVPPHMIGHLLRSTYNNIEHQSIEFVRWTLRPWLVAWEQELNRKLLMPEERRTLYFHHDLDDLERGDLPTRTNALKEQFFNGKITLNEWRASDDQKPIGPEGDLHFVQQAMIPLEIAAKGPPQPAAPAPKAEQADEPPAKEETAGVSLEMLAALNRRIDEEAAKREQLAAATFEVVDDVVRLLAEREAKDVRDASRKPRGFIKWVDEYYADHSRRVELAIAKPFKACLIASGRTDCIDDALKRAVELHVTAGREALMSASGGNPDEFPAAIERCVSTWDRGQIRKYLENGHAN